MFCSSSVTSRALSFSSSSPLSSIGGSLRHQGQQSQIQLSSDVQQERLILELQYLKK
jgi:hypothetical protein